MALYRDHAVVLRSWKLGEADRVLALLTAEHGKVRAVAKGARKMKNRSGARIEPTMHAAVQLYRGRGELDTLTQAQLVDAFAGLRGDLARLGRAAVMLEVADRITPDREPVPALYRLLVGTLRALDAGDRPIVLAGFLLKLLVQEGVQPSTAACLGCGSDRHLAYFDPAGGGVRCHTCGGGILLPPGGVETIGHVLEDRLRLVWDTGPEMASALERAATAAMEHHLERRLRSPAVLSRAEVTDA
jgi:DNA repair protein RecO (recombination protein O)